MAMTNLADWVEAENCSPCETGAERQRSEMAAIAEGCLRASPYAPLRNINCEYREGRLILKGCLPSYYLKQQAQTFVADVEGVGQVVNLIEVCSNDAGRGNN